MRNQRRNAENLDFEERRDMSKVLAQTLVDLGFSLTAAFCQGMNIAFRNTTMHNLDVPSWSYFRSVG